MALLRFTFVNVVEHRLGHFFCLLLAIQADAIHENVQAAEVACGFVHHSLRFSN